MMGRRGFVSLCCSRVKVGRVAYRVGKDLKFD